jgi:hypothetical protein
MTEDRKNVTQRQRNATNRGRAAAAAHPHFPEQVGGSALGNVLREWDEMQGKVLKDRKAPQPLKREANPIRSAGRKHCST